MQVQKLLGKGSYGIVYRVKRLSDGGVYALKEADVRKMSPLERADAVNEIRLLASVKHPNVVRYHEAFLDGKAGPRSARNSYKASNFLLLIGCCLLSHFQPATVNSDSPCSLLIDVSSHCDGLSAQ